jgi:hypothetical protein
MKPAHAALGLAASLLWAAQAPGQILGGRQRGRATAPAEPPAASAATPAASDPAVRKTIELPPEPIPLEDLRAPKVALPDVPLDPYLLRVEHGPFMVAAHTFRGPEATRYALALALELQQQYRLPAYVFHLKIQPGGSNVRNVQPTAPPSVANGDVPAPEKFRVFDEAAVLVGNCKTIDEAEKLLKHVKKIKPQCLDALPSIWGHRKGQGLYRAYITANPLQAAQNLYPGRNPKYAGALPTQDGQAVDPFVMTTALEKAHKPDPLVKRMNGGPRSITKCPGPYTLQVAEFTGRTSPDPKDPRFQNEGFFRKSPLITAADDAEQLAANLAKCKALDDALQPYVYHDRVRSIVTIGSFTGPDDPNLARLMNAMPAINGELLSKKFTMLPLAPMNQLLDVPRP